MTMRSYAAVAFMMLAAFFTGCNKNNDEAVDANAISVSMQNNESEDAVQDAIDAAEDAFDGVDDGLRSGRTEEPERCATIRINDNTRTITVDYGNGCNIGGNRTRKGKMTITYRGSRNMFAERTVVFDNYNNGSHTINGTVVISDRTLSGTVLSYNVLGTNLTITRPNGRQVQISEFRRSVRYNFGTRPLDVSDDEMQVTGSTTGTTEEGRAFTANIVTPILMKGSCVRANTFYPVSGRYEIKSGGLTIYVDWGNGDCDKKITITVGNITIERTMP
ncbi:hypothetical protein [Rhodoflexus caldus]|uniref:hypothetical protein n=1 Tax=Rhodoflexus caldus TaxID=2891236 RepID=UPI00202A6DEF|nr:hypothetical protein [Rhodoflexus caldus]